MCNLLRFPACRTGRKEGSAKAPSPQGVPSFSSYLRNAGRSENPYRLLPHVPSFCRYLSIGTGGWGRTTSLSALNTAAPPVELHQHMESPTGFEPAQSAWKADVLPLHHGDVLICFIIFQARFPKRPPACFLLPPPPTFAAQKVVKSSFKSELLIVLFIIYIYILYLTCYIHVVRE